MIMTCPKDPESQSYLSKKILSFQFFFRFLHELFWAFRTLKPFEALYWYGLILIKLCFELWRREHKHCRHTDTCTVSIGLNVRHLTWKLHRFYLLCTILPYIPVHFLFTKTYWVCLLPLTLSCCQNNVQSIDILIPEPC